MKMGIKDKELIWLFPKGKKIKLLAIFSHPDDESFLVGGILAKAKKEGIETVVVSLSRGERGRIRLKKREKELARTREREFKRACKVLGVDKPVLFNFPDFGFYKAKRKLQEKIKQFIRKEKPQVVITHDPSGGYGHPDHIVTSFLVKEAITGLRAGGVKVNLYFPVSKGKPAKKRYLWADTKRFMPKPTLAIDVSSFVRKKARVCREYRSQISEGKSVFLEKILSQMAKKEFLHRVDFRRKYPYPEI